MLGGEVVAFAIIEKPFANITTGAVMPYTMDVEVKSNYVYNPKLWDAFSMSLDTGKVGDMDEILNKTFLEGRRKLQMYRV